MHARIEVVRGPYATVVDVIVDGVRVWKMTFARAPFTGYPVLSVREDRAVTAIAGGGA